MSAFPLIGFDTSKGSQAPIIIGAFGQSRITSLVDTTDLSSASTTAATQAFIDAGGMIDFAYNSKTNLFSLGVQIRGIKRVDYEDVLSGETLLDQELLGDRLSGYSNSTFALAADVSMLWTFADIWFPTLAVSMMNVPISCKENYLNPFSMTRQKVCGTVFRGGVKNKDALKLIDPTNLMVGLSMTPRITRKVGFRVALEMHHINLEVGDQNWGLTDVSLARKLHGGIEIFVGNPLDPSPFSITAGVNQSYLTYGINIKLGLLELAYAKYSEDVSTTNTSREDVRHSAELSFEF